MNDISEFPLEVQAKLKTFEDVIQHVYHNISEESIREFINRIPELFYFKAISVSRHGVWFQIDEHYKFNPDIEKLRAYRDSPELQAKILTEKCLQKTPNKDSLCFTKKGNNFTLSKGFPRSNIKVASPPFITYDGTNIADF